MFNIREGGYKSLCQPFSWSMAATLSNSIIAICVHPQAIPLAMIDTNRKSIHGFLFSVLYGYEAPLGSPLGCQFFAIKLSNIGI